jgi:hypothetical protein
MTIDREASFPEDRVAEAEAQAESSVVVKGRRARRQAKGSVETFEPGATVTDEELDRRVRQSIRDYGP